VGVRPVGIAHGEADGIFARSRVLMLRMLHPLEQGRAISKIPLPGGGFVVGEVVKGYRKGIERILLIAVSGAGIVVQAEGIAGRAIKGAETKMGEVGYRKARVFW